MKPPIGNLSTLRQRLSQLADDCEERAALANDADARSQYHGAAREARMFATMRCMDADGLSLTLERVTSAARLAAWFNGDTLPDAHRSPLESIRGFDGYTPPQAPAQTLSESPAPPAGALNTVQLAERFGMTRQGARKAVSNAYYRGLQGFYCEPRGERCHWYAEPDAMEGLR